MTKLLKSVPALLAGVLMMPAAMATAIEPCTFYGGLQGGYVFAKPTFTISGATPKAGSGSGSAGSASGSDAFSDVDSFKLNGFGGEVKIGYVMAPEIRSEISGFFTELKRTKDYTIPAVPSVVSRGETLKNSVTAVHATGYYDIQTGTAFSPYLGVGIGVVTNKFEYISDNLGISNPNTGKAVLDVAKNKITNVSSVRKTGFGYKAQLGGIVDLAGGGTKSNAFLDMFAQISNLPKVDADNVDLGNGYKLVASQKEVVKYMVGIGFHMIF